ncbi:hypothetical protein KKC22_12860 [Myxococcota bacterium]|nr:hypothetical protein [Myxococcota bacterium]
MKRKLIILTLVLGLLACKKDPASNDPSNNVNNVNNINNINNLNNTNNVNNLNNTTRPSFTEPTGTGNDPYFGGTPDVVAPPLREGVTLTISGTLDAHDGTTVSGDSDGFAVTLDGPMQLTATLKWVPSPGTELSLTLLRADRTPLSTFVSSRAGELTLWPVEAAPGGYILHVAGKGNPAALSYEVVVSHSPLQCARITAAPAWTEVETDAASTANDTLSMNLPGFPRIDPSAGTPETTGITLGLTQTAGIAGVLSGRADSPDQFLDRDTYAITAGDTAGLLWVRVDTDDTNGAELDLFVLDGGSSLRGAAFSMEPSTEKVIVPAAAGETLRVTVGRRKLPRYPVDQSGPLSYSISLCMFEKGAGR